MTREDLKLDILKTYFPDECEIAGSSNIEAIANGSMTFVRAKHGVNMPVVEILTLLAVITSFVDNIISITEALVRMHSNRPNVEEIKKVVESSAKPPMEIDPQTFDPIYTYILEWLQEEHGDNIQ